MLAATAVQSWWPTAGTRAVVTMEGSDMVSRPVDVRQIVGALASESRALLWAKVVVADGEGGDAVLVADLTSSLRRDLRALERAGLVVVSDGRVHPRHGALREALSGASGSGAVEQGPERFLVNGVLESLPRRTKDRIEVVRHLSRQVIPDQEVTLSEREVMTRLKTMASDPVGARRALVDFGFVGRDKDGAHYWLRADEQPAATRSR